jgi:hypothetical protein
MVLPASKATLSELKGDKPDQAEFLGGKF